MAKVCATLSFSLLMALLLGFPVQAETQNDATDGASSPSLSTDVIPSMFFGSISPNQAIEYSRRLQALRLTDQFATVELSFPTRHVSRPQIHVETVDRLRRGYVLTPEGTKYYISQTSAAIRLAEKYSELKTQIAHSFSPVNNSAAGAIMWAMVFSQTARASLIDLIAITYYAILYADTTLPSVCANQTENCIQAQYGQGSTSDKAHLTVLRHSGYDYAPSGGCNILSVNSVSALA